MKFETLRIKIEEWLLTELTNRNLFLVDIKFSGGRQIEVYMDSDEGIHISECAEVSRCLEKKLDESGLLPDNYILEVSSPGISNPLKVPRQYKRRIGELFQVIKTDGTQIEGQLIGADEDKITLREILPEKSKTQKTKEKKMEAKGQKSEAIIQEWAVNFSEIKKATIQFPF